MMCLLKAYNAQFTQLLATVRIINDHIFETAARRTIMDEFVLQYQRRSTDDLVLARVLHNGYIIVAALFHLSEAACSHESNTNCLMHM